MVRQVFALSGDVIIRIRVLFSVYMLALDAIVFVVDSADTDRIPIAKTELMAILNVISYLQSHP